MLCGSGQPACILSSGFFALFLRVIVGCASLSTHVTVAESVGDAARSKHAKGQSIAYALLVVDNTLFLMGYILNTPLQGPDTGSSNVPQSGRWSGRRDKHNGGQELDSGLQPQIWATMEKFLSDTSGYPARPPFVRLKTQKSQINLVPAPTVA